LAVGQARRRLRHFLGLVVRSRQRSPAGRRHVARDARRRHGGSRFRNSVKLKIACIAFPRNGLAAADAADISNALLAQDALDAADGVAFAIEQRANALEEINIIGTIETPAAAALHRLHLGETRFPESQDVLGNIELRSDFADRPESLWRLLQHASPPSQ